MNITKRHVTQKRDKYFDYTTIENWLWTIILSENSHPTGGVNLFPVIQDQKASMISQSHSKYIYSLLFYFCVTLYK